MGIDVFRFHCLAANWTGDHPARIGARCGSTTDVWIFILEALEPDAS